LVRRLVPRDTLDDDHVTRTTEDGREIASGHRTALEVVRTDVREDLRADRFGGRLVDSSVEQEDRDPGIVGLEDRWHQLLGSGRREQDGIHSLLNQILDDLVLAFDVCFTIGGQRHQMNALGLCFANRGRFHRRPKRRVERLGHKGDGQGLVLCRRP